MFLGMTSIACTISASSSFRFRSLFLALTECLSKRYTPTANNSPSRFIGYGNGEHHMDDICLEFMQSEREIELLSLNHGYKGRAIKITNYHTNSQTLFISAPSTMSYPQPGVYYIQSSSHPECYASIRSGENVLRGEPFNTKKSSQRWRLDWVDNASGIPQFWCALTSEKGEDQLGIRSVDDYQPVYSTDNVQSSWFLKARGTGYVVGVMSSPGSEYNWFLNNKDEPIIILGDKSEPQTWKFVHVN